MGTAKAFSGRSIAGQVNQSTQGEKILLVEDDPAMLRVEEKMLLHLGYRVSAYPSSRQALDVFKHHPRAFDLVVTDLFMPEMTGMMLAQELVKIQPGIPILICSGCGSLLSEKQKQESGIKGFIAKPMRLSAFAAAVKAVLNQSVCRQCSE